MSIFFAEFLGTFILIYLGCGVVAGDLLSFSKAKGSGWIIITLAWGCLLYTSQSPRDTLLSIMPSSD